MNSEKCYKIWLFSSTKHFNKENYKISTKQFSLNYFNNFKVLQNKLGVSEKTVIKAFKQLTETKLIFKKRQGLGKPNLIYVGNITVNHFNILDKLKMIVKDNLVQLLDILKNIPNIQNAKNYLMICLYNNLVNINRFTKKADNIKPNEREYPAGSLDFLYANLDIVDGIA